MGQKSRSRSNYITVMGVQTSPSMEECAAGTEQSANDVASMDAQIKSSKEVCALGMEQR